jgi:hypothetical protein
MGELYSLESVLKVVRMFVALMDRAFPGKSVRIGIYEGGFTNDKPWMLRIVPSDELKREKFRSGFINVEMRIDPQTLLDFVDHGGGKTPEEYASAMFAKTLQMLAENSTNPETFMAEIRAFLAQSIGVAVPPTEGLMQ